MCPLCRVARLPLGLAALLLWLALAASAAAQTPEFRAYWVDAFHAGFLSASDVNTLTNDLRAGHFNAVVVEMRKRGDAYYTPNTNYADYEPHATGTSPANFDALADLINKCHNTNYGPRIEVHAWLVTYPIWNNQTSPPASSQHPYNRHPEWLMPDNTGATWDSNGSNYNFDPGHPDVQRHTFFIAMNLVTNYDLDGLNFDYVRYPGNTWGYHPTAVSRFHARYGGSGNPSPTDPNWLQFRRDQVSGLVRKIYLTTLAAKPAVKVSADTICYAPGITTDAQWTNSAAYASVLQDWRAWMQEGILDLNLPMMYFNYSSRAADWTNWSLFIKDHRYNRHLAIGAGIYLNSTSNAIVEMRSTREPTANGNSAGGLSLFSFAVTDNDGVPRATFEAALTTSGTSAYDSVAPGIFWQIATTPVMPWKSAPANGHLKGFVYGGSVTNPLDGASVTLSGPVGRAQTNDATGFYGFVDLPPGNYTVSATMAGMGAATNAVTIRAGVVATSDLLVPTNDNIPPVIANVVVTNITDGSATILWTTDENADSVVEYGTTTNYGTAITNSSLVMKHSVGLSGLTGGTNYHFRVKSKDAATNQTVSADFTFATNPWGVVTDIIIDDNQATTVGSWIVSSSSPGYYGTGYRYKGQGSGSAYVEFRPNILTAGSYQVSTWYVQGGNRATDAPYVIASQGGSQTVDVNQQVNGGQWFPLGTFPFAAGTGGYVRITDAFTTGSVVIADAVKFVFVPPPTPPTITVQPQSLTVTTAQTASFSVAATGSAPLGYQWQFNGTSLAGANSSVYTLTNAQCADAGHYSVVVFNGAGVVTSDDALLTVLLATPPHIDLISLLSGGQIELLIGAIPAHYAIDGTSNLLDWLELTNFTATTDSFPFIDSQATNSQRFYRVRWIP